MRRVSRATRSALPDAVLAELETEIVGTGYAGPLRAAPATEPLAVPTISLTVNGQVFRAFLHGNQLRRARWWQVPVRGTLRWIIIWRCTTMARMGRNATAAPTPKRYA